MNKVFIITSCIETDNNYPLTYSNTRSIFTIEERFRQTVFTLTAVDLIKDQNTKIYLIDSSENWKKYREIFSYYPNLNFIGVKDEFPDIYEICRSHPNKSLAEAITLSSFLTKYKDDLKESDYLIKISGRYFFDRDFNTEIFNETNTDKIFFKNPLEFEFDESWNFKMVDRRSIQGNNKLYWYCSGIFGWGTQYTEKMLDIFRVISVIMKHPDCMHYQIETLLYFFTRQFEKDIIHVDWKIIGFDSVSGNFIRY